MSILQIPLLQPRCQLSFSSILIPPSHHSLFLRARTSVLPLPFRPAPPIRMGGGPRTYPGGVSKWQWKRMQAKKAKQLLKARLTRERQIYEMRKRAELKAAVSELERPWEAVERAPILFSFSADEQLKVLADRFQRPGGFDLWTERDGPELFKSVDELPSARFFPKGVVHSVKPYGKVAELEGSVESSSSIGESEGELDEELDEYEKDSRISRHMSGVGPGHKPGSVSGARDAGIVGKQLHNIVHKGSPRNTFRIASSKPHPRAIGDSQFDDPIEGSAGIGPRRVGHGRNRNSSGRMRGRDAHSSEYGSGSSGLDLRNGDSSERVPANGGKSNGRMAKKRNPPRNSRALGNTGVARESSSGRAGFDRKQRGQASGGGFRRGGMGSMRGPRDADAEVFDMSLREDGSYGL